MCLFAKIVFTGQILVIRITHGEEIVRHIKYQTDDNYGKKNLFPHNDHYPLISCLIQLHAPVSRSRSHEAFAGLVEGRQTAVRPVSGSEYF